jgi:hypothetical protein
LVKLWYNIWWINFSVTQITESKWVGREAGILPVNRTIRQRTLWRTRKGRNSRTEKDIRQIKAMGKRGKNNRRQTNERRAAVRRRGFRG